jgi:hypothetical protein
MHTALDIAVIYFPKKYVQYMNICTHKEGKKGECSSVLLSVRKMVSVLCLQPDPAVTHPVCAPDAVIQRV